MCKWLEKLKMKVFNVKLHIYSKIARPACFKLKINEFQ